MRTRGPPRLALRLALGLALALTCRARCVGAEAPQRVALLTSEPEGTTARRLEAELRALGLEVALVAVSIEASFGRAALEEIARGHDAFAAVRVIGGATSVEVWIADRVTGKTVIREVRATDSEPGARDDTIAVGTVELLRASLLELSLEPEPRHGEIAPPPIARELARAPSEPAPEVSAPRGHAIGLALGPVIDAGVGGVGSGALMQFVARWQSPALFGLEAGFGGPFIGAKVSDGGNDAEIRLYRLSLGATVDPALDHLSPSAGLGIAEVCLESRGRARDAGVGRVDSGWTPAGYARVGLAMKTGAHLRVRLDAALLVAAEPLAIRFGGDRVARWGAPALEASLALELTLPR